MDLLPIFYLIEINMDLDSLPFIPGMELSNHFFFQGVKPVMESHFPKVSYAAAHLDFGSDVLGFDTPQSRDHGWGPKATLFLSVSPAKEGAKYK